MKCKAIFVVKLDWNLLSQYHEKLEAIQINGDQWIPDMVKHRNFTLVFISIVFQANMKLLSYEQFHNKGNIEIEA